MKLWTILLYVIVLVTKLVTLFGLSMLSMCKSCQTLSTFVGIFISTWLGNISKHFILIYASGSSFATIIQQLTCIVVHFWCLIVTQVMSCSQWWANFWQWYVLIRQFVLLIWWLTELAIWQYVILRLLLALPTWCIRIVFWFEFDAKRIN